MSSKAARRELPELADELALELSKIENMGALSDEQFGLYSDLKIELISLGLVKIGIFAALNNLQYKIDLFSRYFWIYDDRQAPLKEMIELINEFLESPRYDLPV